MQREERFIKSLVVILQSFRVNVRKNRDAAGGFDSADDRDAGEPGENHWAAGRSNGSDSGSEGRAAGVIKCDLIRLSLIARSESLAEGKTIALGTPGKEVAQNPSGAIIRREAEKNHYRFPFEEGLREDSA